MNFLLEVDNLAISFEIEKKSFLAVDRVSFGILPGEIVGLVGESGCGKSVTALGILRLIPSPPGRIESGRIFFKERDLMKASPEEMRRIRGKEISMIFQEPMNSLSPLHRIGEQLAEALLLHEGIPKNEAWDLAEKWLEKVHMPDARERMHAYPFHLSGGMQQRVMIAMALILKPDLVIADEPTTALDVTVQAQIFDLILKMRAQRTSILLITHNMGIIWEMADRVMIMYASRIIEEGGRHDIFKNPAHPYTRGLLQSIPKIPAGGPRLKTIPGYVPSPVNYPSGCRFRDRCEYAFSRCAAEEPVYVKIENGHKAACFLLEKG
jgi:peptide/nickel transport system ATP-binding protein/oligopeptide transport system ATP-binding protein